MLTMTRIVATGTLLLLVPATASPQQSVALGDPDPPAREASAAVGWLRTDRSAVSPDWNRWSDAATAHLSASRFIGRHVTIGSDLAASTSALVYSHRVLTAPDGRTPVIIQQQQRFRMTTIAGAVRYQVFDNRYFHPVLGGGVEWTRQVRRIEMPAYIFPLPPPPGIEGEPTGTTVTWRAHPFADAGFKWYVAERTFIRGDLRLTFSAAAVKQVSSWSGVGVDF